MVWFQCEDCGDNLKKPKLSSHFRTCSAYKVHIQIHLSLILLHNLFRMAMLIFFFSSVDLFMLCSCRALTVGKYLGVTPFRITRSVSQKRWVFHSHFLLLIVVVTQLRLLIYPFLLMARNVFLIPQFY